MSALDQLSALKTTFGRDGERRVAKLLTALLERRFRDADSLIRLHESVLFLRAYPHSPRVLRLAERILGQYPDRLHGVELASFEPAEVSGIAGTAISTNYSHSFARFLSLRHGAKLKIDWENYEHADRLGPVLARLSSLAAEDWFVEPGIDWRCWFEALKGSVRWLVENVDPQTYDALELLLLFEVGSKPSRSHARLPAKRVHYQTAPLLTRRDVSLPTELAGPRIATRRLGPRDAERAVNQIIDTNAVRYRELWGFCFPDIENVYRASFGRGVDLYWFGIRREARLPLRAYHCGGFFKNGVPIGYVESLTFFDRMEVGFNLYYTFRDGESAWLYARFLAFCKQQCGVTCFSIDPYQLGHENEEAIASGAFWFYRKLGFHSASSTIQNLVHQEEARLRAQEDYRTPPAMLRRLAREPLLYGSTAGDWRNFSLRAFSQKIGRGEAWPAILRRIPSETSAAELQRLKNAAQETRYIRLLQRLPKLRQGILRLGHTGG